jgi:hypothetical protein
MALFATPALGAQGHVFESSFGEPCPGAPCGDGQLTLAEHSGVAINQESGDVYVADTGNGRIQQFSSTGTFIRAFGSLASPTFIAIDNSSSPSKGDVYVADTADATVHKYDAEGNLVTSWASSGILNGSSAPAGPFGSIAGIAVGGAGTLYVERNEVNGPMFKFEQDGTFIETFALPFGITPAGIAVDSEGNIYAVRGNGSSAKVSPTGAELNGEVSSSAAGLATNGTDFYVTNGSGVSRFNSTGGRLEPGFGSQQNFVAAGIAVAADASVYVVSAATGRVNVFSSKFLPKASTEAATDFKPTSATLNGTVSADGGPQASCEFQYIAQADYQANQGAHLSGFQGASAAPCEPAGPFTGAGEEAVTATASGLDPETGYLFRLLAFNSNGVNESTAVLPFTTPPAVNLKTTEATNITKEGATLSGEVDPEGTGLNACFFEYVDQTTFESSQFSAAQTKPCAESPASIGAGETAVPVHADVSGLTANTTYHFRVAAANAFGTSRGAGESFETHGPPTITSSLAFEVTITTAKISAQIDPHGEATTYQVEYLTEVAYEANEPGDRFAGATVAPDPAEDIGSGTAPREVQQLLGDLTPDTAYRFRFVATNAAGAAEGPVGRFVTFIPSGEGASCPANEAFRGGASAALPDCRAYEMVTPQQKLGEPIPPDPGEDIGGHGSCQQLVSCVPGEQARIAPMQSSPDGEGLVYLGQAFTADLYRGTNSYFATRGSAGWETQGLSSRHFGGTQLDGYNAFSKDLTSGILYQQTVALTADAPSRAGKAFANLYRRQGDKLQALVTEEPPHRDPGRGPGSDFFKLAYGGANPGTASTPAFSHVLFAANDALTGPTPFAPAAPEVDAGSNERGCNLEQNCNLYEWEEGQLRLVNVLPGNTETASGAVFGSRLDIYEPPVTDRAISDDGSRIFWSAIGQTFVRIDGKETKRLQDPGLGRFLTATPDGSKALLGDGCLYDLEAEACEDLTGGKGGFEGILGGAEDLSRIYFVDTAVLAGDQNAEGEEATEGGDNLYLWDEGTTTFIGTLLASDNNTLELVLSGGAGTWKPYPSRRLAQVSADGRYLAFMSAAPLTGYDNEAIAGGDCRSPVNPLCSEVFEYDAASGSLACVSCNPSGQRPMLGSNLSVLYQGGGQAYSVAPMPAPHNLTADGSGRIFFESRDTLTAADTNGRTQDIYEWEPNGVGSCKRAGGCVSLISSGHAPDDSFFVNSTPSGNDAFFITREQLVARDTDEMVDIYDARVNGGFDENVPSPCQGEACRGPATTAPASQSAGSALFSGPGNEKPKKHTKRKKKHKKKHAHKRPIKHGKGGSK